MKTDIQGKDAKSGEGGPAAPPRRTAGSAYQQLLSASIVLTVITAGVVGAVVGYALDGIVTDPVLLAVLCALIAVLVAALVRHLSIGALIRDAGPGPGTSGLPGIILINSVIASFIGGLAGYQLTLSLVTPTPIWTGFLSGVLAGVLMALLMVSYRAAHGEPN